MANIISVSNDDVKTLCSMLMLGCVSTQRSQAGVTNHVTKNKMKTSALFKVAFSAHFLVKKRTMDTVCCSGTFAPNHVL